MATINIGDKVASSLRKRSKEVADTVTNHNAALRRMSESGRVRPADGGREIQENLHYSANTTADFFSAWDVLDTTPAEVLDAATFAWKQLAATVSISELEKIQNAGGSRMIDLLANRVENAMAELANKSATSFYSDGTGSSGKEFGGLQLLVQDDPTSSGSVGGIAQDTYSWWQNQYTDGGEIKADTITGLMNSMWRSCLRGNDKTDIILADDNLFGFYEDSLQTIHRIGSDKEADAGFESIMYKSAPVVYDDQCPTDHMYFLNTNYLWLRPFKDQDFVAQEARKPFNQAGEMIPILYAGNLTVSNRARQGVIFT